MVGVLNVDKPTGMTSHDVVAAARRALGIRRVGHSGTLDPAATGVLLLCLGPATRLVEYLHALPKTYVAQAMLGIATDTQDVSGQVVAEADASAVTETLVREALGRFQGEIWQTPPMVSALKVGGRRLYERARAGEEVPREPRRVTIHSLSLDRFEPGPRACLWLTVTCSSGTYIRTLVDDLGRALSCGATLVSLRRTAIGQFRVKDAVRLADLGALAASSELAARVVPLAAALAHLSAITLPPAASARVRHGEPIPAPPDCPPGPFRLLDESGDLLAVAEPLRQATRWLLVPRKVFGTAHAAR
ncbi:MAG: tRNA pseudouridine(55) synthase TruB [Armatimonadetes bacterium]|nr:tRNA pseudouridine(55) synthase TruB [Armatimonadota bacterium]